MLRPLLSWNYLWIGQGVKFRHTVGLLCGNVLFQTAVVHDWKNRLFSNANVFVSSWSRKHMLPFYFWDSGSSLLSLLWILFQVDCLFPLHLFGLVGFYLAPSSVTYFFAIPFFFNEWDCAPVLLVVWPEASNTGVCRLLGGSGSWCWDEELHETSLWWIFIPWGLKFSVSPVVQNQSSHCRSFGQHWAHEPRFRKLPWVAKAKKQKNPTITK